MLNDSVTLVQLRHKDGKPIDLAIVFNNEALKVLVALSVDSPSTYGRLMHYNQARVTESDGTRRYWIRLQSFDWDTIRAYIEKELEAYG